MTLLEMSALYADSAAVIQRRIVELRQMELAQTDPEAVTSLRRRIAELVPLWREMREMTRRTACYYEEKGKRYAG